MKNDLPPPGVRALGMLQRLGFVLLAILFLPLFVLNLDIVLGTFFGTLLGAEIRTRSMETARYRGNRSTS